MFSGITVFWSAITQEWQLTNPLGENPGGPGEPGEMPRGEYHGQPFMEGPYNDLWWDETLDSGNGGWTAINPLG